MKVKTSELTGVQLDFAVARSIYLGQPVVHITSETSFIELTGMAFSPTTNWSQCGPLIEQFDLVLNRITPSNEHWRASTNKSWKSGIDKDPKIAICLAVVILKLGKSVDIPDELTLAI